MAMNIRKALPPTSGALLKVRLDVEAISWLHFYFRGRTIRQVNTKLLQSFPTAI